MAGLGRKTFTAGEVLSAANVQGYLQDQTVMVFSGTAARGSAIGTATEGMVTYLTDSDTITVWDGASWATVYPVQGDISGITAGTGLSGGGASGDVTINADYSAIGSALAGSGLSSTAGTINFNATAVAGTGLTGSGSTLNVNVGSLAISGTQVAFPGTSTTTSMTATASLENGTIWVNGTAAVTITVPDVLQIGDTLTIWRNAGGTVTIAAGTGVSDWAGAGTAGVGVTYKIDQTYNAATVQKVASGTYRVVGKITA